MRTLSPARPGVLAVLTVLFLAGCSRSGSLAAEEASLDVPGLPAALLWSRPYTHIAIEIDYVEGRAPLKSSLEAMVGSLREHTGKGVILGEPTVIGGYAGSVEREWTLAELEAFHEATFEAAPLRGGFGTDGRAALQVLYLDGSYSPEGEEYLVRGLQMGLAILIFRDVIQDFASSRDLIELPEPRYADAEQHTLLHELGHAYGLVNCGIPMLTPREDSRCHSSNQRSVMAAIDRVAEARERVEAGHWGPFDFDEADLQDLAAYRTQEPRSLEEWPRSRTGGER